MPDKLQAVILAGGKSKRFNTGKTKLIEKICGKEMILYPVELMQKMNFSTTMVIGFQQEKILEVLEKNSIKDVTYVQQTEQLGTGHALQKTKDTWHEDHILVMNADIPLMTEDTIEKLYKKHVKTDADISFVIAHTINDQKNSSPRILINDNKINVIEGENFNSDIDTQCYVSAGVYIMKKSFLNKFIDKMTPSSLTQELYLPELIQLASDNDCKIITSPVSFDVVRGVNTLAELWVVEHIKRSQIISYWMNQGVRFAISLNVMIDVDVVIEPGAYIGSGVHLLGKTIIQKDAIIGAFAYIKDSVVEQSAKVQSHTVINKSTVGKDATVVPFTHLYYQQVNATPKKMTKKSSPLFTGAIKDDSEIDNTQHNL